MSPDYARSVRRALVLVVALLGAAPGVAAAAPSVVADAAPGSGAAPLAVTLTATGDAASYRWQLGDGTTADGPVVQHTYRRPGAYTAVVVATALDGSTVQASARVTAYALALAAPRVAGFGTTATFAGRIAPPVGGAPIVLRRDGARVASARTGRDGRFRIRTRVRAPGAYEAAFGEIRSPARALRVRPLLETRLDGSRTVGSRLRLVARVRPADAGEVRVRVASRGTTRVRRLPAGASLRLDTRAPGSSTLRVELVPRPGYAAARRTLAVTVVRPELGPGSRGPSVRELERRLAELRMALPGVDDRYDLETYQAVLAFQKLHGLRATGRVDAATWSALHRARAPRPRHAGSHIEVSKGRQLLFVVRNGAVTDVVHVSTGATGNTPIGRWQVYRKVPGWDWVLWYPLYFLRGFAIHGYPSVPAYPASHGCVRVPMWIAPKIYAGAPYGQAVYVYW
jgi:lipoprotein-anchoring transpeptidase ErfK/SrfK